MPAQILAWDGSLWSEIQGSVPITPPAGPAAWEWADDNLPWAYTDTAVFTEHWPTGLTIVDLQTGSGDFYTDLQNTVNTAGQRVIVRLPAGVFHFNQFRLIGSSGKATYAFGFWNANLKGLLGAGPDQTFVQMDADSMTQAQLDAMATMTAASFAPIDMGVMRIDGTQADPIYLGGLTFRSDDQQMLTAVASDVSAVVPQPAPHNGISLYPGTYGVVSYVRFQAAGRAATSAPPFECANIGSQYGGVDYYNCELDGRISPDLNAAQPRRCGVYMGNNEDYSNFHDTWLHHSNVSRYAVNDQNRNTAGLYTLTRCKIEHISDNHNTDPALNGGASLQGYTNASLFGWESCNGIIELTDVIADQDNLHTDGSIAQHLQFTSVGSRNPQGGRLTVTRGVFRNSAFPIVDGYLCMRVIPTTYWWLDGFATTMSVLDEHGNPKTAVALPSGTWPPTAASLSGKSPDTHYLIYH